mmetsp:Transcript_28052/g.70488  ORF Transcript_28052/g.70488 Transcript_28052/m.70488 type:complete len:239 (+) Transcript_28052:415-1131(+)
MGGAIWVRRNTGRGAAIPAVAPPSPPASPPSITSPIAPGSPPNSSRGRFLFIPAVGGSSIIPAAAAREADGIKSVWRAAIAVMVTVAALGALTVAVAGALIEAGFAAAAAAAAPSIVPSCGCCCLFARIFPRKVWNTESYCSLAPLYMVRSSCVPPSVCGENLGPSSLLLMSAEWRIARSTAFITCMYTMLSAAAGAPLWSTKFWISGVAAAKLSRSLCQRSKSSSPPSVGALVSIYF